MSYYERQIMEAADSNDWKKLLQIATAILSSSSLGTGDLDAGLSAAAMGYKAMGQTPIADAFYKAYNGDRSAAVKAIIGSAGALGSHAIRHL